MVQHQSVQIERQSVQIDTQNNMLMHVVEKINTMSMHPHPPSSLIPSFGSPRTRNQGQQQAAHGQQSLSYSHIHQVSVNRRGTCSSSSTNDTWLPSSNGDGRDTKGYSVGPRCKLIDFLGYVSSWPLGTLKPAKQFNWISANWTSFGTQTKSDKLAGTQNTEAKKIMELVLHLATEAELSKMFDPLPETPIELAAAIAEKKIATEGVIDKVMDFLEGHEKKTNPSSTRHKKSTTGALYKRWGSLNYTKADPNHVEQSLNNVRNWAGAEMMLSGFAVGTNEVSASSSTQPNKKRKGTNSDQQ